MIFWFVRTFTPLTLWTVSNWLEISDPRIFANGFASKSIIVTFLSGHVFLIEVAASRPKNPAPIITTFFALSTDPFIFVWSLAERIANTFE